MIEVDNGPPFDVGDKIIEYSKSKVKPRVYRHYAEIWQVSGVTWSEQSASGVIGKKPITTLGPFKSKRSAVRAAEEYTGLR